MAEALATRLLVVDTDTGGLAELCARLARHGFEAAGFSSRQDALAALQEQDFDLILTDLPTTAESSVLPEAWRGHPHLAAVVMTPPENVLGAMEALKQGALDYVLKPVQIADLLPVLQRALEIRRLRLENVQLRESVQIYDLCRTISATVDLEQLLNEIADAALRQCQADEASLMLPTADGEELTVRVVRGEGRSGILGQRLPLDHGVAGWVARHRKPVTLHGSINDPRFQPIQPRSEIRCSISMPMVAGGQLVGVLNVNTLQRRRAFSEGQVKALHILASIAASAVKSALLFTQVEKAQEKYRSIFENAVDGIFQTTPDGKYITANPALARMLGYASPEELTATVTDIPRQIYVHAEDRVEFSRLMESQEITRGYEVAIRRKDGSPIWVSLNGRAVRDEQGEVLCYEGIVKDITERRRAEEALRQSEDRFHTITRVSPVGIFQASVTGDCIYVNERWEEYTGLPASEYLGMAWVQGVHGEDRQRVAETWLEAVRKQVPFRQEFRFIRADGKTTWLLTQAVPELQQNGAVRGFVGTFTDITELKQAAESLRQSEARYRFLFDRNLAGVVRMTLDGRILDCNESLAAMLGFASRQELLNHQTWDFHPTAEEQQGILALLRQTHRLVNHEIRLRGKDGNPVWFLGNINLLDQDEAEPVIFGTFTDITERKRVEDQLRQAGKMEAVGRLAGGIAHDFNNILTIIKGYSELLLARVGTAGFLHDGLDEINRAGSRAAGLTQQLLAFSRRQMIAPRLLDVNAVIADMESMMRRLIGEDVELVLELAPGLRHTKADPGQLGQVLMNLVVNARDAMPQGGRIKLQTANVDLTDVDARLRPEIIPGPYVVLTLTDTGTGMDADTMSHIFEPFFTTKALGQGTGLGLATAYGIIKQSEGYIYVFSEKGVGTTFKIYLPEANEVLAPVIAAPSSMKLPRGSETILLVEDDPAVRSIIQSVLVEQGYSVVEAENGSVAHHICKKRTEAFDLLLTDVILPQFSGPQLAMTLTARWPSLKVLFISGYTDDDVFRRGLKDPETAFLQKPFTPKALAHMVRQVLDRPANAAETCAAT